MAAITRGEAAHINLSTVVLRTAVIGLTLATAAIHFSLGGLLFLANTAGYTVLALAMVVLVSGICSLVRGSPTARLPRPKPPPPPA